MLDLAIIGSGPAALTAALYAARDGLTVKIFEKSTIGGRVATIPYLENYPGFTGPGEELIKTLRTQAESFGAKIEYGECTHIALASGVRGSTHYGSFLSLIIDEKEVVARSVLIATGTDPKSLDLPTKKPISYCAICDAPLYKGKNLVVIGGGNSALSETLHLLKFAKTVTLINRSPLSASKSLVEKARKAENLTIFENTVPTEELLAPVDAVFVFIGSSPSTSFLDPNLLSSSGFVVTDENYMSKLPGLFAAGDVRENSIKQAVTAAAEGAAAALNIRKYLESRE